MPSAEGQIDFSFKLDFEIESAGIGQTRGVEVSSSEAVKWLSAGVEYEPAMMFQYLTRERVRLNSGAILSAISVDPQTAERWALGLVERESLDGIITESVDELSGLDDRVEAVEGEAQTRQGVFRAHVKRGPPSGDDDPADPPPLFPAFLLAAHSQYIVGAA